MKEKKQFAFRAIKRIQQINAQYFKLKDLGVDLLDLDNAVNLLEEAIVMLFVSEQDHFVHVFDDALNELQWWIYEDVDKTITLKNGSTKDLTKLRDFINYFAEEYK